jgi:hypothetical protein
MMRFLVRLLAAVLLTALFATPTSAQAGCTPQTTPAAVVFGRSMITFQSADHNAVDPAGALKVADYFGEVRVKGVPEIVTNFTIPKASVTPLTGTGVPAGCLQTLLPAMGSGLLPTNTYALTFFARNSNQAMSASPQTVDFFLSQASVPAGPTSLRLVTP